MSRLSEIFRRNQKCFIPFVTAGFPDLGTTRDVVIELAKRGAHIVEIGIPFSDPIADGPVIQRSSFAALENHYSISDYVALVREIRSVTDVGLIFMTYMNPVFKYGLARLETEAADAGLDGILISDLTPEEYAGMRPFQKLDTVFLAAPTSSDPRISKIAKASSGFVYLVARTGVTGKHTKIGEELSGSVARLRTLTDLPIAVGFGISDSEDVRNVWKVADGAVVGTAIVRFMQEHLVERNLASLVGDYVTSELIPRDS